MGIPPMSLIPPMPISNMAQGTGQSLVYQANITIVGNKTSSRNSCCFCATYCLGSFLIFPLCFMCCMWWKKIVYPRY